MNIARTKPLKLAIPSFLVTLLVSAVALASNGADNEFTSKAWIALAAGLGIGIAAFGGALGQGRAAAAALDGIARNPGAQPKIFTPMMIGLALIERGVMPDSDGREPWFLCSALSEADVDETLNVFNDSVKAVKKGKVSTSSIPEGGE